ncbi:PQQ-binding-like beta-propeller repeat protein [Sediminicurvatus halobius]|uniref:ATP/GTP-binding protein n=1 Tax=Sediminicurvatus halobius TaxID=2182432 RepID=A0A2U2MYN9_9GAMM|nr:PQQ-binding-like beta-propeller repeat protein [Spiribacter halobius]PWG61839.1 ATP/GTP-binding protein [Spiribacter halobius]UEX77681.1 PQQ-binding-like beta-propeller repeat protein [Spiribacter halobius]
MKTSALVSAATAATLTLLAAPAHADGLEHLWTTTGFAEPESVVHDTEHDRLIVSNIDGHPGEADGQGFLSLLRLDGAMLERQWVTGLDAPKGMAIHGDRLYVSDLTELHVIDLTTGTIERTYAPSGAQFLNDVTAAADGRIFVSDMMSHTVYELDGDALEPWLAGDPLAHPNGVLAAGETLYVGNWGEGLRSDFTTEVAGGVLALNVDTGERLPLSFPQGRGNIDGLVMLPDYLVASDWVRGTLMVLPLDGTTPEVHELAPGVADIGHANDVLLVPQMQAGEVAAYRVASTNSR